MVCPPFASGSFIEEYGVVSGHDDKQLRVIRAYMSTFSLSISHITVYMSVQYHLAAILARQAITYVIALSLLAKISFLASMFV
jgi:hypothetical protein